MQRILRMSYLIGCFALAMIALFSMVYAQGTCPTPGVPANLSPSDGSTNISVNPTLSWSAASNADFYNVYCGTSASPSSLIGQTAATFYSISNLKPNTTHYWRITAVNNCGNFTSGPIWSFITGCPMPEVPSNPTPSNDEVRVPISIGKLRWSASLNADFYNIYLGTSNNPPLIGTEINTNTPISDLSIGTTYFWRIEAIDNCGNSTAGPLWSFTTSSARWTNISPPDIGPSWELTGVHFTSENEGWAVGTQSISPFARGVLLHYLNGSWTVIEPPNVSNIWDLRSVHFTSSNEGWAVGCDLTNQRGVLLHYFDGSWISINPPDGVGCLNGVHFTSPHEGWAVGGNVLLHYLNGYWEAQISPDACYWGLKGVGELSSVYLTSSDEGWAVGSCPGQIGSQALILHYSNGSWKEASSNGSGEATSFSLPLATMNQHLNSVHFPSPKEGYAVGIQTGTFTGGGMGILFHYSNDYWKGDNFTTRGAYNSVYFISPFEGWVVGRDERPRPLEAPSLEGVLLQYWNSWIYTNPPEVSSNWELNSVHLTSPDEGWAVGTDHENQKGVLLRFSNFSEIILQSPFNNTRLGACSLYSLPTFSWTVGETFKTYEIQFSSDGNFGLLPVKVRALTTSTTINSNTWKKVLSIPGGSGGTIYWRVVGTRPNRTTATSEIRSITIEPPVAVGNANISSTSKSVPPKLSWETNCNIKFKAWFGSGPSFTKKTAFTFNIKNPNDNGGIFTKLLTKGQWKAIRRVVGDTPGSTIYWYVESWDGLKRYSKTEVMNFILLD